MRISFGLHTPTVYNGIPVSFGVKSKRKTPCGIAEASSFWTVDSHEPVPESNVCILVCLVKSHSGLDSVLRTCDYTSVLNFHEVLGLVCGMRLKSSAKSSILTIRTGESSLCGGRMLESLSMIAKSFVRVDELRRSVIELITIIDIN